MKSAMSSRGTFLLSEVPRSHVQKLILNITATTVCVRENILHWKIYYMKIYT